MLQTGDGYTALICAAQDCVKELVKAGAELNAKNM